MPGWKSSPFTAVGNKGLTRAQIKEKICDHVRNFVNEHEYCFNSKSRRSTKWEYIQVFCSDSNCFHQLVEKLDKYESQNPQGRQLFIHGVITHANLKRMDLCCGERKATANALTGVELESGETVHICNNSLMYLFGIGHKQFKKLEDDAMLPAPKNTDGYDNDLNKTSPCTRKVIDFLFNLFKKEGETNATRIVRVKTRLGLRDKDYNILHLPSFYSKRKLYERFCYMNGWEIKSACDGSYPPLSQYQPRKNDDDENETLGLWPEGTDPQIVCSWRSFLRIWKEYLPHLKIRQPSLDTCNLCNEYAK